MSGASPVRVLVDGWHLSASRQRGIGTYLREVLHHLASDLSLAVTALVLEPGDLPPGIEPLTIRRVAPGRFRRLEHDLALPVDLALRGRRQAHVVWCPGPEAPWRSAAPVVQTLHDVTGILFEDPGLDAERRQLRRMQPRYRRAAAFVANSAYTADSSARVLGLDRKKITVAHLGVDSAFRPPDPKRCREPYVLYVGEYGPHKGYAEACAVSDALAAVGLPHRLKIVGRVAPWCEDQIRAIVAAAREPDRIDVVGFVDDLVGMYQRATALVMTSRHEGFGLPLVEAMACATPVVGFANSCIPEVIGDGGTVVSDGDPRAMAAGVAPLLTDPETWNVASARALDRSHTFRWATTAQIHGDVFRAVAERHAGR